MSTLLADAKSDQPRIEMRGIEKAFGAIRALRGASLTLWPSEVLGLVGDNAAGKSTMMKPLTGVHQPDAGEILVEPRKRVHQSVAYRPERGTAGQIHRSSMLGAA